jgi:hypothetical protein
VRSWSGLHSLAGAVRGASAPDAEEPGYDADEGAAAFLEQIDAEEEARIEAAVEAARGAVLAGLEE